MLYEWEVRLYAMIPSCLNFCEAKLWYLLFGTHQLLEDDATRRGEFGVDASRHDDDAALDATVFGCWPHGVEQQIGERVVTWAISHPKVDWFSVSS